MPPTRRRLALPGLPGLIAVVPHDIDIVVADMKAALAWGQRDAMLGDADGSRVDLFAAIAPEGQE